MLKWIKDWWNFRHMSYKERVMFCYPQARLLAFHMYLVWVDGVLVGAGMTEEKAYKRAWKNLRG